jgi:hypothetical protein
MVQNANLDDDDAYPDLSSYSPWPLQTPVLLEFVSGWYEGKIADFAMINSTSGWYQITWSDGTIGIYTDFAAVDEMVQNAKDYDPWTVGTPVFNENGEIDAQFGANLDGTIQAFENGQYSIQWSNGQVKQYSNFDLVDDLVAAAFRKNGQNPNNENDDDDDDDDEPWENGTPVSYEFYDGWWDGTITSYDPVEESYDITWTDGSVDTYFDLDRVDEMVYNAQDDDDDDDIIDDPDEDVAGGNDTVSDEDTVNDEDNVNDEDTVNDDDTVNEEDNDDDTVNEEDNDNVDDTINDEDNDNDDDTINDEDNDNDDDTVNADQGVNDDDYPEPEFEIGTLVYREFEDGWWVGNIVSYEDGYYKVRWTDNSYDSYEAGSTELAEMVANSQKIPDDFNVQVYPIGTSVQRQFSDGVWHQGVIESYQELMYTIKWEDGTVSQHVQGQEMDAMVAAGASPNRMSPAGIAILSIVILGTVVGIAAFIIKRRRSRTITETITALDPEVQELEKQHNGYVA